MQTCQRYDLETGEQEGAEEVGATHVHEGDEMAGEHDETGEGEDDEDETAAGEDTTEAEVEEDGEDKEDDEDGEEGEGAAGVDQIIEDLRSPCA